jgi:hypothetical protein
LRKQWQAGIEELLGGGIGVNHLGLIAEQHDRHGQGVGNGASPRLSLAAFLKVCRTPANEICLLFEHEPYKVII